MLLVSRLKTLHNFSFWKGREFMAENIGRRISKKVGEEAVEFSIAPEGVTSSPSRAASEEPAVDEAPAVLETAPPVGEAERSPEFLELAAPKLPALTKANLARLLMQSPNRLFFYWSIGKNPFHTLSRALGQPGGYMLVLKLVDLRSDTEQIQPVDEKGSWWFDVDADGTYRAEIGFYAVNRPYIRILYSNTVSTPRKSPSPRSANSAEWRVPAAKFARVLDAAGFARDAFDVALAGDDWNAADTATRSAFSQFTGRAHSEFEPVAADELRYAMLALASGVGLAELRGLISERLFALLSSVAGLDADNAMTALKDKFEFDADEFELEEEAEPAVFGASLVGFPRRPKRLRGSKLGPLSSHGLRSGV